MPTARLDLGTQNMADFTGSTRTFDHFIEQSAVNLCERHLISLRGHLRESSRPRSGYRHLAPTGKEVLLPTVRRPAFKEGSSFSVLMEKFPRRNKPGAGHSDGC